MNPVTNLPYTFVGSFSKIQHSVEPHYVIYESAYHKSQNDCWSRT